MAGRGAQKAIKATAKGKWYSFIAADCIDFLDQSLPITCRNVMPDCHGVLKGEFLFYDFLKIHVTIQGAHANSWCETIIYVTSTYSTFAS